jgi:hypothetical protein
MRRRERQWTWYGQTLDLALAAAGLAIIGSMVYRNSYPLNAILLVAFCAGGITASQLIDALTGRWLQRQQNGNGNGKQTAPSPLPPLPEDVKE